jgi:hypothetical protein
MLLVSYTEFTVRHCNVNARRRLLLLLLPNVNACKAEYMSTN